jgi:hypothetical protein
MMGIGISFAGRVIRRQDRPGLGQQPLPGLGQPDGTRRAVEQRLAELAFRAADLLADRRLADVQPLGGPAEFNNSASSAKYSNWRNSTRASCPAA